jgi:hypothetical protein
MMLLETIIGALLPVAVESGKQIITKWVGGVRPTSIDEQIKLEQAEVSRIEALAKLDTPVGTPSQWVIDLRASARYVGALLVIAVGISTLYVPVQETIRTLALEAANIAFGFLFGSRIVAGWAKK